MGEITIRQPPGHPNASSRGRHLLDRATLLEHTNSSTCK